MFNPILKNKKTIYFYLLAWIFVSAIHAGILFFFYKNEPVFAIVDAIVFNAIFGLLGIGLWYPVRYIKNEQSNPAYLILNHVVVAFLSITLWLSVGYFVLNVFIGDSQEYINFINLSLPWRITSGVFIYMVIILVYYLIIYYTDLQEKVIAETELKTLVKESELTLLKSQINPHFLFNSLNSISALTVSNPAKAQEMVVKLSEFLRYALKHDQRQKTHLEEELHNIELYLDIEKIRFGKKLKFEQKFGKEYSTIYLPNMILQPLVENAIKHGVYPSTDQITISLDCSVQDNFLVINIQNNYDPEYISNGGNGLGLRNIKNRLFLIYNREDLLTFEKEENVFNVKLLIPIKKENSTEGMPLAES